MTSRREVRDEPDVVAEFRCELDVPGETRRQALVFAVWVLCLFAAVMFASLVGAHVTPSMVTAEAQEAELRRSRVDRLKVAVTVGLALPVALTLAVRRRYRRGGAHARGIRVDVTAAGELRLWGRGYGTRVQLAGARFDERLVDVYAGRLGTWRQRRLRVRGARGAEVEVASPALDVDALSGLRREGGEGDCVELARDDYDRLVQLVRRSQEEGG